MSAGYASATAINNAPDRSLAYKARQPSQAKGMGEVALAVLDRPESVASVLSIAARLLQYGGGGRDRSPGRSNPAPRRMMIADQSMPAEEEQRLRAEEHVWADAAKAAVSIGRLRKVSRPTSSIWRAILRIWSPSAAAVPTWSSSPAARARSALATHFMLRFSTRPELFLSPRRYAPANLAE